MFNTFRKTTFNGIAFWGLVILFFFLISGSYSWAERERGKTIHKGYPKKFDGSGPIDRIDEDAIVIRDAWYKLASDVTFHAPANRSTTIGYFEIGYIVGFIKNKNGEINSLWLIRKKRE